MAQLPRHRLPLEDQGADLDEVLVALHALVVPEIKNVIPNASDSFDNCTFVSLSVSSHRSSLEMSTPIVTGLSMLVFITEPKFFRINFIAPQPTVMYLRKVPFRRQRDGNKMRR